MAKTLVDLSHLPRIEAPGRIAILQSKWYPEIVGSMAAVCERVLRDAGYQRIEQHVLPGSLELPLAAKDLLAADVAARVAPDVFEPQTLRLSENGRAQAGPTSGGRRRTSCPCG